jgi:sec-independent protein translocase protein TatA
VGEFSPWHLLILAGIFVVLFGAKRLPDAARSLGQSARIFKSETRALHDNGSATPAPAVPAAPPVATPAPVAPGGAAAAAAAPVAPQPAAAPPAQAPQA